MSDKLNIFVRRDFSQKSYRAAMAVHAALLWQHRFEADPTFAPECVDWDTHPDHGPIIAIFGVKDRDELIHWTGIGPGALYREPDLPKGTQEAAFAWYGDLQLELKLKGVAEGPRLL